MFDKRRKTALISQLSVERVILIQGRKHVRAKKRKWEVKPRPQLSRMLQWNLNQNTLQSDRTRGRGCRGSHAPNKGNLLFVSLFIIFPLTTLTPTGNNELLSGI
ncbi:hypothetical protein XENOCAPTIV_006723 [Xenoophorus captivus]|uniref:Uncharacterized protein n=1 Tax=Xenoophorus captivus TaxID=1517983 RepID=A0ABV0RXH1_9TELE